MDSAGGIRAAPPGAQVAMALSLGVLALALNEAFANWVLFTDTLLRRFLF